MRFVARLLVFCVAFGCATAAPLFAAGPAPVPERNPARQGSSIDPPTATASTALTETGTAPGTASRAGAKPAGALVWPRAVSGVVVPQPRPRAGRVVGRVENGRAVPVASTAFAARAASDPVAALFAAAKRRAGGPSDSPVTSATASVPSGASRLASAARSNPPRAAARSVALAPISSGNSSGDAAPFAGHGRRAGDLGAALDALRADRYDDVLSRRNALDDPLDTLIVDYFLLRAGTNHLTSAMVADIARRAKGWPSPSLMRRRAEEALSREQPDADTVIAAMGGTAESDVGVRLLARALLEKGDERRARALVRSTWHDTALGQALQSAYLADFAPLLTADDHLTRVDKLIALKRYAEARALRKRLAGGPRAYVEARLAAATGERDASARLTRVPADYRRRPGYRLAEVEVAWRDEDYSEAARLLGSAPRDGLVDGDAWWVETRIVARSLAEQGDGRRAYRLAVRGFAEGRVARADEAFHAGWFALEALDDPRTAERHFSRLAAIATTPISASRAAYWQGRAAAARRDRAGARAHYREAAEYGFTYYGQLARTELGLSGTGVPRGPRVTAADRAAIAGNTVAKAIERLIAVDHGYRMWPLLKHLARTVPTAGQLALVAEVAEDAGYLNLAVMAAKEGQRRGLDVGRLAYPTQAIPQSAKIPRGLDRALVYSIARQESLFNEGAVSPAGARGLMQVMPRTAASMARTLGLPQSTRRLVTDPAYNVAIGSAYLAKRLENFGGSYILTFAAYNAGAGRVSEWIDRFGDPRLSTVDAIHWVERIPYPETRNYVMRVMENIQVYREALGTGGLAIATDLARGRRG